MKSVDTKLRTETWKRLSSQLSVPVYKTITLSADMPYVQISGFFDSPFDTKTEDGQRGRLRITIFSDNKDTKEVTDLKSAVTEALHDHLYDFTPDFAHCSQRYQNGNPQMYTEDEKLVHQIDLDFENITQNL